MTVVAHTLRGEDEHACKMEILKISTAKEAVHLQCGMTGKVPNSAQTQSMHVQWHNGYKRRQMR